MSAVLTDLQCLLPGMQLFRCHMGHMNKDWVCTVVRCQHGSACQHFIHHKICDIDEIVALQHA